MTFGGGGGGGFERWSIYTYVYIVNKYFFFSVCHMLLLYVPRDPLDGVAKNNMHYSLRKHHDSQLLDSIYIIVPLAQLSFAAFETLDNG